jgi:hypothetical protein
MGYCHISAKAHCRIPYPVIDDCREKEDLVDGMRFAEMHRELICGSNGYFNTFLDKLHGGQVMLKQLNGVMVLVLLISGSNLARGQSTNDYRSHQTGNWNSTSTWERWNYTEE